MTFQPIAEFIMPNGTMSPIGLVAIPDGAKYFVIKYAPDDKWKTKPVGAVFVFDRDVLKQCVGNVLVCDVRDLIDPSRLVTSAF